MAQEPSGNPGGAYASLSIAACEGDPEVISALLDIRPDNMRSALSQKVWRDGIWMERPPYLCPFRHSVWGISTKAWVHSDDCSPHIDWLLERVKGKKTQFAELREAGWSARIAVFWPIDQWNVGVELKPTAMGIMADLGISVWFDIYCDPPEDLQALDEASDSSQN